jgi:hypothetical protein
LPPISRNPLPSSIFAFTLSSTFGDTFLASEGAGLRPAQEFNKVIPNMIATTVLKKFELIMFNLVFFFKTVVAIILGITLLNSCAGLKPAPSDARKVSPNVEERVKANIEEGRGFRLMGGKKKGWNL